MQIEIHGLSLTIKEITHEEVQKLSDSLGMSLAKFTAKSFTSAGNTTYKSYIYAFTVDQPDKREKKSKQSIFWQLGEELTDDLGNCSYYNARLTLNGSFFDCSPDFNLNEFLIDVAEIGQFNVTQVDLAYFHYPERGLQLKNWMEWFGKHWREYLTGNLLRNKVPDLKYDLDGNFLRVELGNADSKTNYATFYQRPDGQLRFEIKFRDSTQCNYIIQPFLFPENVEERRLEALVSQFDVCRKGTTFDRQPVRHPAFAKLLASNPHKVSWKQIAEEMKTKREMSDKRKYNMDLKRVAGFLNNFLRRYEPDKGLDVLLTQLQDLVAVPVFTN